MKLMATDYCEMLGVARGADDKAIRLLIASWRWTAIPTAMVGAQIKKAISRRSARPMTS
jgi:acetyl-CoA carboxylase alpha subunit